MSKILALKAMLRSIPNRIHTRIDVDSDKAQGAFRAMVAGIDSSMNSWNALATRIRTIGTVISNMIKGSLISNITLVVPIIASMVPALFAVLNAIGVVAGGAAGLAAAFGVAASGVMGFGVMAASAIKCLTMELYKLQLKRKVRKRLTRCSRCLARYYREKSKSNL